MANERGDAFDRGCFKSVNGGLILPVPRLTGQTSDQNGFFLDLDDLDGSNEIIIDRSENCLFQRSGEMYYDECEKIFGMNFGFGRQDRREMASEIWIYMDEKLFSMYKINRSQCFSTR